MISAHKKRQKEFCNMQVGRLKDDVASNPESVLQQ